MSAWRPPHDLSRLSLQISHPAVNLVGDGTRRIDCSARQQDERLNNVIPIVRGLKK